MPALRLNFPETLPTAAKFSGFPALNDGILLVRAFKQESWVSEPLLAGLNALTPRCGRPRMAGEWGLVAIAWIASRQGDIQPFHDRAPLELWHECGFDHRPSYATTHARLTELEGALPEIEAAIGLLVQRCRQAEPRIGRHVHIDGTEADTHSRFFHACQEGDACSWQREGETMEEVNHRMLGKATTDSVQRQRQREDAGESSDLAEEAPLSRHRVESPPPDGGHARGRNRKLPLYSVTTSKHKWLTHDPDAGFRTYKKPAGLEGWHGYYHSRAVDDFTGLTLYGHVTSSSRTELSQYTDILRGIIRSINPADKHAGLDDNNDDQEDDHLLRAALLHADVLLPEAILGDRGLGYVSTYEQNTRLGIQSVMPWRNFNDGRKEPADITLTGRDGLPIHIDRDGVIHCKHCGGPTRRVEFRRAKDENPRIYVTCLLPSPPDSPCRKLQSVSCDVDWRMLTPVARNDDRCLALECRFQFERAHHLARVRNRTGAKDPILRPKRLGQPYQQLLLNLGTMVDWLRAGLKHGWFNHIANTPATYPTRVAAGIKKARQVLDTQVANRAEIIRVERRAFGLDSAHWPPEPEPPPPQPAT
jgi:hypothetical protein